MSSAARNIVTHAWLEPQDPGQGRLHLLADTTLGRGQGNTIPIVDPRVSATHARVRYIGVGGWVLRDLGSKNGTTLGELPVQPGKDIPLADGALIRFGGAAEVWKFHAGLPVELVVRELSEDSVLELVPADGLVALPSPTNPHSLVFRHAGGWLLERARDTQRLKDLSTFKVDHHSYQVRICDYAPTVTKTDERPSLARASVNLRVSRDEEHVSGEIEVGGNKHAIISRVHSYLLVVLARARIADHERGLDEDEAGWCQREFVQREMGVSSPESLNLHVYRVRKDFGRFGFEDSGLVIERRRMSGQLRLSLRHDQLSVTKSH